MPERSHEGLISADRLRELSTLSAWRGIWDCAQEWACICAAAYVSEKIRHPFVYILTVIFIGARMHSLGILIHDAVHYRTFPNRRRGDLFSKVFMAWPTGFPFEVYRRFHLGHHRHLNTQEDPDFIGVLNFPVNRIQLIYLLVAGPFQQFVFLFNRWRQLTLGKRAFYFFVLAAVIGGLTFGCVKGVSGVRIFTLYWVVPLLLWVPIPLRIRSLAEHYSNPDPDGSEVENNTGTIEVGVIDWAFVVGHNINYHLAHHLFPSVPHYRLAELHRLLLENPEIRARAHVSRRGYFPFLAELYRSLPTGPLAQPRDQRPRDFRIKTRPT